MARTNVHTASREELIEAGVRAELAEEILKLRRKGRIEIEALEVLPGVGPVTIEQLRKSLDFSDKAAGNGDERAKAAAETAKRTGETGVRIASTAADVASSAARGGAEVARSAAEAGARFASTTARSSLQTARRTTDAVAGVEREALQLAAEGTTQLGQMLLDLVHEQTRHNAEALTALSQAVDWERVFQLQSELMRANLERMAEFTRRYVEITQAVLVSAASTANQQTRKVA